MIDTKNQFLFISRRLCPDISFFQHPTEFPASYVGGECKNIKFLPESTLYSAPFSFNIKLIKNYSIGAQKMLLFCPMFS